MHFVKASSLISLVSSALLVSAAPIGKRAASAGDITVFKFADVLEQLESQFYSQALAQFHASDFTAAGFPNPQLAVEQLTAIQSDEATHASVLEAAIQSFGATPISGCKFDFSSALKDVTTMAAVARVVENVGVSAYLGGAALLSDPVLLTSAASILSIEARHQTVLNVLSGTGTAIPAAFDFALTPSEVLALASPFISGCDVGVPANPVLSVTNTGTVAPGTQLTFSSAAINSSTDTSKLFCQMLVGGQPTSLPFPFDSCVVPQGINGPVAIFITSDGQPLVNNPVDRATTQLVAGPTLAFIDTESQVLSQTVGIASSAASSDSSASASSGSASASSSTQTISPAQASAVVASASVGSTTPSNFVGTPGTSNQFVGPVAGGSLVVDGWSSVPNPNA